MSAVPPPLRFLAVVAGGWVVVRGAMIAPNWWVETVQAAAPVQWSERYGTAAAAEPVAPHSPAQGTPAREPAPSSMFPRAMAGPTLQRLRGPAPMRQIAAAAAPAPDGPGGTTLATVAQPALLPLSPLPALPDRSRRRWSGSAWMLARQDRADSGLAPLPTLGGSQAGLRLLYRLNGDAARPLALSGRVYVPLRQAEASEAAAGLDWQPFANVPLHLLAERRQAIGSKGRSAFGLTVYGGHAARLPGGLRIDGYAQAGVVGLRSRDLFIDGAARIWVPARRLELGGVLWGAAQPGAERLDAGPQISYRLPVGRTNLRVTADWRFRLAGDAEPGSGPALTVASDF